MFRSLALSLTLALSTACVGSPFAPSAQEPSAGSAQVERGSRSDVSMKDFIELKKGDIAVIDVRTPGEYRNGHVPGAAAAPLQELSADHPAVKDHPKDQPLYVICQSGGRSSKAADDLARAGYTTINVQGGTGAWVASGQPVE